MDPEKLARALQRNPDLNVPRPLIRRPDRTNPRQWVDSDRKPASLESYSGERTQKTQWLTKEQLKAPWKELHPEPSKKDELESLQSDHEHSDTDVSKKRGFGGDEEGDVGGPSKKQKIEETEKKVDKGKGKEKKIPQPLKGLLPKRAPAILPLSPQPIHPTRMKDEDTDVFRKEWPGPGTFEYKWKDNPNVDEDRSVRNTLPDDLKNIPIRKVMPERVSKNSKSDLQYMGGQKFHDMEIIDSGDCFFAASKSIILLLDLDRNLC